MTAAKRVVSVNVGLGRDMPWHDRIVHTGIFKAPVAGRVRVTFGGLEGDEQGDPAVHGGPLKAALAYPSEHYAFWRHELPGVELPWGAFGENLTLAGILEDAVRVGDRFRIGTAVFASVRPRWPCYKLGIRLDHEDVVDRYLASGRTGFYLRVLEEGTVGAGDAVDALGGGDGQPRIADLVAARQAEE